MSRKKRKMSEGELQEIKSIIGDAMSIVKIPFEVLCERVKSRAIAFDVLYSHLLTLEEYSSFNEEDIPDVPMEIEGAAYLSVFINSGNKRTEVTRHKLRMLIALNSEEELMEHFGFETKEALRDALEMADDLLYIY